MLYDVTCYTTIVYHTIHYGRLCFEHNALLSCALTCIQPTHAIRIRAISNPGSIDFGTSLRLVNSPLKQTRIGLRRTPKPPILTSRIGRASESRCNSPDVHLVFLLLALCACMMRRRWTLYSGRFWRMFRTKCRCEALRLGVSHRLPHHFLTDLWHEMLM